MRRLVGLPLLAVVWGAVAAPPQPWKTIPHGLIAALKAHHVLVPGWKFFGRPTCAVSRPEPIICPSLMCFSRSPKPWSQDSSIRSSF